VSVWNATCLTVILERPVCRLAGVGVQIECILQMRRQQQNVRRKTMHYPLACQRPYNLACEPSSVNVLERCLL
jgi:hypothetical protein